jgi:hypothetical protein
MKRSPERVGKTLGQGRESRLWCMLAVESIEQRGATMLEAVEAAASLVEDESSPVFPLAAQPTWLSAPTGPCPNACRTGG